MTLAPTAGKGPCILVCGGRAYDDRAIVFATLDRLSEDMGVPFIITGGATGADTAAIDWAWTRLRRGQCSGSQTFLADWKIHGPAAGPIRNARMLAEGKPDLVVAFPGGRGTANMVAQARAAGVRVLEVTKA